MKINRFNEHNSDIDTRYDAGKIYYMIFDINEDDLYDTISNRISELNKNLVNYDMFYKNNNTAAFLFIYPHCTLYNMLKYEYIFSITKNKEENREIYLNNGYKIITTEEIPLLVSTNKFNL